MQSRRLRGFSARQWMFVFKIVSLPSVMISTTRLLIRRSEKNGGVDATLSVFISLLLGLGSVFTTGACSKFQPAIGYNKNYQPDQPLPFDHSLHAGQYQIKCQYCHNQVERSKHSNIPALSTCMNCHIQVKTDSPFITKIREAYEKNGSIEWVRVHMLPDHVQFNHSAHVQKGVSCNTCHGPVDTMKTVYQFSDLSMGWCVNCHRQPENKAPLNCTTCHH